METVTHTTPQPASTTAGFVGTIAALVFEYLSIGMAVLVAAFISIVPAHQSLASRAGDLRWLAGMTLACSMLALPAIVITTVRDGRWKFALVVLALLPLGLDLLVAAGFAAWSAAPSAP